MASKAANASSGAVSFAAGSKARRTELRVRFTVKFNSVFGQRILLSGSVEELGRFDPDKAVDLAYEHPGIWTRDLVISMTNEERAATTESALSSHHSKDSKDSKDSAAAQDYPVIKFKYILVEEGPQKRITWESGSARVLETHFGSLEGDLLLKDTFRYKPCAYKEIFSTAAFTNVIFRRDEAARLSAALLQAQDSAAITKALILGKGGYIARFRVFAAGVKQEDELCVTGSAEFLGKDDHSKAVPLADTHFPYWTICLPMGPDDKKFTYRFLIRKKGSTKVEDIREVEKEPYEFELNHLDTALVEEARDRAVIVFPSSEVSFRHARPWRGAGVAIPVFSIRSKTSCGVGEFVDLKKMVDFCVQGGYQLLQLLPINDTTVYNSWRDTYPYSANSCFALHPQYMNIETLGSLPSFIHAELEEAKTRLNALKEIDYVSVMKVKMSIIRKMYAIQKSDFLKSREFLEFFKANQGWLVPYALFRMFMDLNGTANFDMWGTRSKITLKQLEDLASPDSFHFDYIGVVYYTQFHLHKQLTEAAEYAAKHSVVFKGDLPIGVNRYCTDTWVNPELFRLQMQAGAPPDYFAEMGQNWGFPTYAWEVMAKDGYNWWKARLGHMSRYFHAFRIDHILGFFRIWEVPERYVCGLSGRYRSVIPIRKPELDAKGLWDMDRYLSPYVHDATLQRVFGSRWDQVKSRFFEPSWGGRLKFKAEYNTEKKIEAALTPDANASKEESENLKTLRNELFKISSNVLLLQDEENPEHFHPRFMLQESSSYQELSREWKAAFDALYQDYFFVRQNQLWKSKGMEKLPMMKKASNMMVCGEDLGFIPECVPEVMEATSIVGLRVQRMPETSDEFGNPATYPWETVATLSTHDTSTFRGWYESLPLEKRKRYYTNMLKMEGEAPESCSVKIVERAVDHMLASKSIWAIFPIQDLLGFNADLRREVAAEEQINDPANPDHIWNFRLHIDMDTILKAKDFVAHCKELNKTNQRGIPY
mmetsp:Transcript_22400/g.38672  ORF Transcript_22400/g.38672 Transcript_22400/m.38672 type:complete len:993 (+) Transcript_22400:178-3156(+)|eukprot:CAMPEP_0184694270 /NCGR_PEP_ID=MMETSP0313-20130426/2286_1 /TAXON_ID=2792 /ORGANISM="Porphyridium aerugineum, Strain SAG 1380-2" /LENGTH=992 /DNA_ID=CAMNT_0027152535 /DNA_START=111 /DNA_END=3089 /DNA_ORIENTATION=+